jgi:hypothetical protein
MMIERQQQQPTPWEAKIFADYLWFRAGNVEITLPREEALRLAHAIMARYDAVGVPQ